ncbi:MAG: hypothetical protein ACRERU_04315, partial [Methylococcales bacterium]
RNPPDQHSSRWVTARIKLDDELADIPAARLTHPITLLDWIGLSCTLQSISSVHTDSAMTTAKATTPPFRFKPGPKEPLRAATKRKHHSIATIVGMLIQAKGARRGG